MKVLVTLSPTRPDQKPSEGGEVDVIVADLDGKEIAHHRITDGARLVQRADAILRANGVYRDAYRPVAGVLVADGARIA